MKYQIEVEEILRRIVEIEAENPEEAEGKVRALYTSCDVVLEATDFIGEPSFRCL